MNSAPIVHEIIVTFNGLNAIDIVANIIVGYDSYGSCIYTHRMPAKIFNTVYNGDRLTFTDNDFYPKGWPCAKIEFITKDKKISDEFIFGWDTADDHYTNSIPAKTNLYF